MINVPSIIYFIYKFTQKSTTMVLNLFETIF